MQITHELLQQFSPFNSFSPEYLDKAISKISVHEQLKNSIVFTEGEALDESFYLIKGKIELKDSAYRTQLISERTDRRSFSLNEGSPVMGSAMAKSRIHMFSIERDFLDLLVAWTQSSEFSLTGLKDQQIDVEEGDDHDGDWMSYMLQSPLMMQVPPANIQQLFTLFEEFDVAAGEQIIKEGSGGDYFYVIQAGVARVTSRGSRSDVELEVGSYFGEEALVGNTLRNASVVMLTEGTLMRLDKAAFTKLLQEPVMRYIGFDEVNNKSTDRLNSILDVRLPIEHKHSRVPGSVNIPLGNLRKQIASLQAGQRLVVTDDGGRRSQVAAHLLCQAGFDSYILRDASLHYA